ncbi:hypothetical protein [uncultured Marinobacter sp.]|uniref:hypothetical protein n=1 Tax=uncultured Marinobacter sp. TaxID=187379 RepID=UPI0030D9B4AF
MKALINRTKAALSRVHPLPQNDLTLRFPIIQNREKRLRELLSALAEDPAHNDLLPFARFRQLHFARFLILEGEKHPEEYGSTLIFLANVDGPLAAFLEQLTSDHSQALDRILSTCEGYPTRTWRSHATRIGYLFRHQLASQAYYVNTLGRSAEQIRQEEQLYQALQQFLNNLDPDLPFSASTIRDAAIAYVADHPDLAWALTPRPRPGLLWRTWETTRFRLLVALGILAVIWGWPLLLAWLLALRFRELRDTEFTHKAPLSRLDQLRSEEDMAAHNPFAAAGYLKPGLLRRITARGLLAPAQVALRHVFNRGDLAGVPLLGLDGVDTIHFARWTMLDGDRRLLFTSNYDGSLESYMVDFIDKVAWGLNLIFSNGAGYPRTRWLVMEGARKEQRFKDYLALHQLENLMWYTPYPQLTAVGIANNEAIRNGLSGTMDDAQAQAWLNRL